MVNDLEDELLVQVILRNSDVTMLRGGEDQP
jgi:hypothetical protein